MRAKAGVEAVAAVACVNQLSPAKILLNVTSDKGSQSSSIVSHQCSFA
jgi:hypothetical protein